MTTAAKIMFSSVLLMLAACKSDEARIVDVTDSSNTDSADEVAEDAVDGSGDEDAVEDATTSRPGFDQNIIAMSEVHVYFGAENRREVDATVTFPSAEETYSSIKLLFNLSCPDNRCDPWDRWGSFGILTDPGAENPGFVELSRFITPFGVGAYWEVDVTDLRPLLIGEQTVRVFIDTWVGPGSGFGNGWEVEAVFEFIGGEAPRKVLDVIPVWLGNQRVVYGDPARTVADQLSAATIVLPAGTESAAVRSFITGHGQGNAENCAEFCAKEHTFSVDDAEFSQEIWRDDCETTGAPNQQGTWQYPRAGWCPGAEAYDWTFNITDVSDGEIVVDYDVEPFENTCRPGVEECSGCTLGSGCDYNDSSHTEPNYQVSALVIAYGE